VGAGADVCEDEAGVWLVTADEALPVSVLVAMLFVPVRAPRPWCEEIHHTKKRIIITRTPITL
jgi:hypothetical protein